MGGLVSRTLACTIVLEIFNVSHFEPRSGDAIPALK